MTFASAPNYLQKSILIAFLLAVVLSVCVMHLTFKRKMKWLYALVCAITSLSSVFSLISILSFVKTYDGDEYHVISMFAANVPLWVLFIIANVIIALAIVIFAIGHKHVKTRLSNMSVKESFDTLPSGICFAKKNGIPRLVNVKINDLCIETTGKTLLDANKFWSVLTGEKSLVCAERVRLGNKPIVKTQTGQVYSFKRLEHFINGEPIYEIIATDVTRRYALSVDLSKKNKEIESFNKRMREYGENIEELTAQKETLNAKIRTHDELGKLLLTTRKTLAANPSAEEKRRLLATWQKDLACFLSTKESMYSDTYGGLFRAAKAVGVTVEVEGEKPCDKRLKKIVVTSAIECITNTVKHAKGDFIHLKLTDKGSVLQIEITNNGTPPNGKIIEGGGFSSLRALCEREGGRMTIASSPEFLLTIVLPKGDL